MRAGVMQQPAKTTFSADALTLFSLLLVRVLLAQPSAASAHGLQSARERWTAPTSARLGVRFGSRTERVKTVGLRGQVGQS